MGAHRSNFHIITAASMIIAIFSFFHSSSGQSMNNSSRDTLDTLLQDFAFKSLARRRTGTLYKVEIPANLSGIEASVVRLRSGSFWARGVNYSNFDIPSRVIPSRYVKRLAIVYQNLGNRSSSYYSVPGYSMVTPVLGFMAYDAANLSAKGAMKLSLRATGNPIFVNFSTVALPNGSNSGLKCVSFNAGILQFSEMVMSNVCATRDQGHFSIVAPRIKVEEKRKERLWKWLGIGFACGFAGLIVGGLLGGIIYKFVKKKRIKEMEKQADEGEAFGTVWIGTSKMPSARVIRTQPTLEHGEVP